MQIFKPMLKITRILFVFLFVFLFVPAASLCAREQITNFDSWINVDRSGVLTVIETISVVAEGDQIKRGIYRDFPTDYRNRAGMRVSVDFKVIDVKRDGHNEPYHTEQMGNGIRLYIGDKDVFLNPGPYTYSITYQTERQIGFFADYDELYWNVTGNDWAFPIELASVTLVLPEGASILQYSAYTGKQGSTASNAELIDLAANEIRFRTTTPLASREGLTIAAAWPKGIIPEPDTMDKASSLLQDNLTVLVGSAGLFILFFYYIIVWFRVGKDPEPGTIIPRFKPPENFTPAAARYVMRMGFDDKTFAAALVDMAVKKYLIIHDKQDTFTLTKAKTADPDALSSGENKVALKLFAESFKLKLKRSNHRRIAESITALEKSLQIDFEALHFKRNRIYMIPGMLITLLLVISVVVTAHEKELAGFMALWLSVWSGACSFLLFGVYKAWEKVLSGRSSITEKGGALFMTFFSLPFFGGWFLGLFVLSTTTSIISIVVLIIIIAVNIIFYNLLRAPTIHGREIMDQLEGLKLYMSVAEKDRLNLINPPDKTPALFEKLLPWALALDVEQQWSEQFSALLAQAAKDGSYTPVWYNNQQPFSSDSLAASLGSSLSSTISSSSTAPGSSSGSGGGGSSGGGGGGGGGGGW
ncbi:MAG: DUF2207 domain-containing protein [Desulfobulbaceae bacterium]|nr:DUF2207 domain-containing protein [Desulfobulbaceae bacterium]